MTTDPDALKAVEEAARAARGAVPGLASVPDGQLNHALRAMAEHLGRHAAEVLAEFGYSGDEINALVANGVVCGRERRR